MAMFSAGVAYFNRVRVVNVIHAVLTSAIIIFFSFPTVKTGTELDAILAQVRQFETIEVVATIVGIVLTDAFFVIWNTGRIRQTENMVEQERSSDELMKIIEAKADEARYATKSKSDFLASMSHEIRTPINSVLGMNEMILRESKEADIRKYAEDIQQAGNMLLSLINNILDFSKIESGKMEIMPVKYDLGMVLNDLKIFVSNRAKNKGLDLIIKASPDIPRTLYGDEIRIKQIVTNILTNAVKYTDTGSVTFEVDFDKADERSILLNIAVTDTGKGMKQEDLNKLFSPFERIDELRNRHIEGTGLGMSIVQQLLAMMGSRLKVRSEYGKGSTFAFTIRQEVIDWGELGDFSATLLAPKADEENRDKELFTAPLHFPGQPIYFLFDRRVNKVIQLISECRVFKDLLRDQRPVQCPVRLYDFPAKYANCLLVAEAVHIEHLPAHIVKTHCLRVPCLFQIGEHTALAGAHSPGHPDDYHIFSCQSTYYCITLFGFVPVCSYMTVCFEGNREVSCCPHRL